MARPREPQQSDSSDTTVARDPQPPSQKERPSQYPHAVNPVTGPLENSADRYVQRQQLGFGSMGEVFLCKDTRIGRDVAKKVLLPNHRMDATLRARFLRECRIQGQLEHPSIVPVYDLGVDEDGATYFTMKCLKGMTLKQVIRGLREGDAEIGRKFNQRRLLTAFSSVCLTIDFAHTKGVLHRDLKPSNVMLGNFGEVYVLDWGIAKLKQEVAAAAAAKASTPLLDQDDTGRRRPVEASDDVHTAAGKILGTFGYMAPEQARGAIADLDARSDVYGLGAILFEILTLEPLHPKTSWKEMLFSTLKGVSARPSKRAPHVDVPPELEEICVKATRTDPKHRYQSARELHEAVERYLDGNRDVEARKKMARSHARKAEERAAEALAGGTGRRASEDARRAALHEVGRTLALEPSNGGAVSVLTKLIASPPSHTPAEVAAELAVVTGRRLALQLELATQFDIACLLVMVPLAIWMGPLSVPLLLAAALLAMGSAGLKVLARRQRDLGRGHLYTYGGYLFNVLSLLCVGRWFGPLFFTPVLLSFFTLGYSMSPVARYRTTIMVTGCVALLGSVALEVLGSSIGIQPSYLFGLDRRSMIIVAQAVELRYQPTMVALTIGTLLMILGPALMSSRQQEAFRDAERRSALQTWHLKHLLPDEAQAPITRMTT